MHKLSKDIDRKSFEPIYESFVRSKLEYECFVWDDCSEQDRLALEKCQLRAARIVTGAKKGASIIIFIYGVAKVTHIGWTPVISLVHDDALQTHLSICRIFLWSSIAGWMCNFSEHFACWGIEEWGGVILVVAFFMILLILDLLKQKRSHK